MFPNKTKNNYDNKHALLRCRKETHKLYETYHKICHNFSERQPPFLEDIDDIFTKMSFYFSNSVFDVGFERYREICCLAYFKKKKIYSQEIAWYLWPIDVAISWNGKRKKLAINYLHDHVVPFCAIPHIYNY